MNCMRRLDFWSRWAGRTQRRLRSTGGRSNLALIEAGERHFAEAERLWKAVFGRDPVELGAGLNLAVVECGEGERAQAVETLGRVLTFAPDNGRAREMLGAIRAGTQKCGAN
jgi:hypothetical protein